MQLSKHVLCVLEQEQDRSCMISNGDGPSKYFGYNCHDVSHSHPCPIGEGISGFATVRVPSTTPVSARKPVWHVESSSVYLVATWQGKLFDIVSGYAQSGLTSTSGQLGSKYFKGPSVSEIIQDLLYSCSSK